MPSIAAEPRTIRSRPNQPPPRESWPFLLCELFILAWIVWAFWLDAASLWRELKTPFQFDYGEGNVLATLARIAHGLTPYPDLRAFPNAIDPYGPVGYYLLAIPVKFFGTSFFYPRLLIAASTIAICLLLGLIMRRLGASPIAAIAFGAIYATISLVQIWATQLRVDLLGLALSVAGLYAFTRVVAPPLSRAGEPAPSVAEGARQGGDFLSPLANVVAPPLSRPGEPAPSVAEGARQGGDFPDDRSISRYLPAAFLFTAAIFCKHNLLAAPAACFLYLVVRRRYRAALALTALSAALGMLALLILELLTRGHFLQHLLWTHPDPFSWTKFALRISLLASRHAPLLLLAVVLVVFELRRKELSLAALWLVLATISAITAGKLGSNWNHFLEWLAAVCLGAGLGWSAIIRWRPRWLALALALAATVWVSAFLANRDLAFDPFLGMEGCGQAYAYVRSHPDDRLLSENVGALLLAGKTVWVLDPFVYSQVVMSGRFPDREIEPRLRSRWFSAVITRGDYALAPALAEERYTPGMVRALLHNYRVARTFQCRDFFFVYEPLPMP